MTAWYALAISALSLIFSALAYRRSGRAELLQRGRLKIDQPRVSNLYEGGSPILVCDLKNVGRDAISLTAIGCEVWIEDDGPDSAPTSIGMDINAFGLAAGAGEKLVQRLPLEPSDLRAVIDGKTTLLIGLRIDFEDAIGPLSATWAFQNVIGKTDMRDKLEPMMPKPTFLQRRSIAKSGCPAG